MHQRERLREDNVALTLMRYAFGAKQEEMEDLRRELRDLSQRMRAGDRAEKMPNE